MSCSNVISNNSGQSFKTRITECNDPTATIDASNFTEAVYRIYAADCTTVLVEAKLSTGDIVVEADTDEDGNAINVFRTTLTSVMTDDATLSAGQYTHQFVVTNAAGLKLPPIFQNTVTVVEVCD